MVLPRPTQHLSKGLAETSVRFVAGAGANELASAPRRALGGSGSLLGDRPSEKPSRSQCPRAARRG